VTTAEARPAVRLSVQERRVLACSADGLTYAETAAAMHISVSTVGRYIDQAVRKLDARSRLHAVVLALRAGII
jgi:DNA-binding CsgD family transcriptional regulator